MNPTQTIEKSKAPEITAVRKERKGAAAQFEPRIVAFLCNWCSYAGADLAGISRIQYPTNVRVIRVMCSGRIDPTFILKALREGADGVLIGGCHIGDCHYQSGNYATMKRFKLLKSLLAQYGLEDGRVRLEWISASEGEHFGRVIAETVEKVRALGPLKWADRMLSAKQMEMGG
jgi:F420-non-reducing hydrogenase iron-sulfur subunit